MAKGKSSVPVLGVMVTSRVVHAVLLDTSGDETQVLRRFMRQRTARQSGASPSLPDLQASSEDGDYTVQFTDTSSAAEHMFLGTEFSGLEGASGVFGGDEGEDKKSATSTFALELGDILAECADAGYEAPLLAFCAGASEVHQVELRAATPEKKKTTAKVLGRNALLELLAQQHSSEFSEESVAFLPMTPAEDGAGRYLAAFPKPLDPIIGTLRSMREQQGRRMPPIRLLDTEVSLYLGLARAARNLTPKKKREDDAPETPTPHNTLIVRAGAEDTLVLFIQDDLLWQSETLRSLTAYEAPETICSRVLLLQDEYGIGEVQHVLLLSEEREDDLVESFEMFFPDARVESLRQYVPEFDDEERGEVAGGALLPAVGVGLRLADDDRYRDVFEDVNLLPKQLLRRQFNLPVTWHVLALYALLFCTVLYFMGRFFTAETKISAHQRSIQEFQATAGPVTTDAKTLQGRIDSLQAVHARYMRAINVLEGLLQGSDKWSRALEKTSKEVAGVTGIWIESWNPRADGLELSGNATARDRVVELAERLGGTISSLTFSEIREWPVFSFKLSMSLENGLPEAARYLREQVAAAEQAAAESVPVTSAVLPAQQP